MSAAANPSRSRASFLSVVSVLLFLCPYLLSAAGEIADDAPPDLVLNDVAQLAELFRGYTYPQAWPWEPVMFDPATTVWFAGELPKELSPLQDSLSELVHGIAAWPLWMTLYPQTGEIAIRDPWSDAEMVRFPVPKDFDAWRVYEDQLTMACVLSGINPAPWEELVKEGHSEFFVPLVTVQVWLADLQTATAFYENLLAETEELSAQMTLTMTSPGYGVASIGSIGGVGGGSMMSMMGDTPCSAAIPMTSILQTTNGNIHIEWASETNAVYAAQFTDALATFNDVPPLFQLWTMAQDDIAAQGTTTVWDDAGSGSRLPPSDPNVTNRFYRVVKKDANFGMPCVRIASPTDDAVVSGVVNVEIAAMDDSRISSITLIVDGNDYATITGGPMVFPINTVLFANGVHTLQARVADNQGIGYLGGDPDSDTVANVSPSAVVPVTLSNAISVASFPLFGAQLPIHVDLLSTNADWSISISAETGAVVRVLSGLTSNGVIDVTWDGLDTGGQPVPADVLYYLTITTVSSGGGGFAPLSVGPTNSAMVASYKETAWNTGLTLLARQKLKCRFPANCTWETASATKLGSIRTSIVATFSHPEIYADDPLVMQADADWATLRDGLAAGSVRQFYYAGHSNGGAIGFNEFTPSTGVQWTEIASALGNFVYIPPGQSQYVVKFKKPFKFVFIDGCLSGVGNWPQAFGTLKFVYDYQLVDGKNRTFLGWLEKSVSSLFGDAHNDFTVRFWARWTEVETRPLHEAIRRAAEATSGIDTNQLVLYGYPSLTWQE